MSITRAITGAARLLLPAVPDLVRFLEIPNFSQSVENGLGFPLWIYEEATPGAQKRRLENPKRLAFSELHYESDYVLYVLERRGMRLRIALATGSGWVLQLDLYRVRDVATVVLSGGMPFLTKGSEQRLAEVPGREANAKWRCYEERFAKQMEERLY